MWTLGAALTLALGAYSLLHYAAAAVFLLRRRGRAPTASPEGAVAVLVPARNEGACAVRAIRSVLEQDHRGPVRILLLLKDRSDTSLPDLAAAWPAADWSAAGERVALEEGVEVVFTGVDPKHAKINAAVAGLDEGWVAVLDADHQAEPAWLRTSIALLQERGGRLIQGRRAPLRAGGFFPLWDSLHQHVGCELLNASFDRLGLTVFFTGTTAVARTSLLRERPLRDCITEDVDLSYAMVLAGERILANPHAGSFEEVSPDLYSFLARRRRWANGHTDAFFRHLRGLRGSPLGTAGRVQFVAHGVHYLVCAAVFVLHLGIGLSFVPRLAGPSTAAAAGVGLGLAALVARSQRTAGLGGVLLELAVGFGWFFPAAIIATNAAVAVSLHDLSLASLPLPGTLQVVGLVGFVAPLVLLLVGLGGFGQLTPTSAAAVLITDPFAFYVDVCGVLLGLVDHASRRRVWRAVARAALPAASGPVRAIVPRSIRQSWAPQALAAAARVGVGRAIPLAMKPSRWLPAVLLVGLFGAGVLHTPASRVAVEDAACEALEADGHPWIVPADELTGYCQAEHGPRFSTRRGSFDVLRDDGLASIDPSFWDTLDATFPCNLAQFQPRNVEPLPAGGVRFALKEEAVGDRAMTAGDLATKDTADARFLYGRFEVEMKPAKASGVLTAFFLYRFDPWQEIDAEFVGGDTSHLLMNVYYNPGKVGDLYNYGYRGTPVRVALGFDASEAFHTYAIEWDADEIRWFVDDRLLHRRRSGEPTPIPHLPMRFHVNMWPTCSEELAGPLDTAALPLSSDVRRIRLSRWSIPPPAPPADWRAAAPWIQ